MKICLKGFRAINDNYHGLTLLVPFFLSFSSIIVSSVAGVVDIIALET